MRSCFEISRWLSAAVGLWAASALPSPGVIVAGTSGTGNNNANVTDLNNYLTSSSRAAFSYWNNLIRVSDASGVYLGYNPTTMRGWVMSANHVTKPTSITVAGNAYTVTGKGTRVGTSDIILYEIGGGVSDPALPSLPTVPLASANAAFNNFVIMTGRGFTNTTTAPYSWQIPGTNDANGMRWGTNLVDSVAIYNIGTAENPNNQSYVVTDFDGPSTMSRNTGFDAQGANGDSGGGLFIYRNGQWQLSGIAHFVLEGSPTDGFVNPSQYGDSTAYSNVYSHLAAITTVTGTLIPEPSSGLLLGLVVLLACRHRRR